MIEYVDNKEQLEKLRGIGAFLIQGYLYSPPLMGDELPAFLAKLGGICAENEVAKLDGRQGSMV